MNPTWNDRLWVKEIRDEKTVQRCLVDALRYCDRQLVLGGGCYSGGIDAGGNRTWAAIELGRQYDADYANKNPVAMAALYTSDGLLVSPSGPIVRGREDLQSYYAKRFASGARSHAIKVVEVHVQGNGSYGLAQFLCHSPPRDWRDA